MKILGIDHVAIATDDVDRDAPFWKYILGINHSSREDVPQEGVTTDIYDTGTVSYTHLTLPTILLV